MKHLLEGLIKQRGVVKINLKDLVFRTYNICITRNELGDIEYGIVLFNKDIGKDTISSVEGSWYIEYYNDELNHTGMGTPVEIFWKSGNRMIMHYP